MGDEILPMWAAGACNMFYDNNTQAGCGGAFAAGAIAGGAADTTGAILESVS